jgi:hypothetical protein
MSRLWKWVLFVVLALSIALNILLIRVVLPGTPHDAWFVYSPEDSFDQASDANRAVQVGGVAAFVGFGDLASAWVPCSGQTLKQADYPQLFAILERNHALDPRSDEHPQAPPGMFRLPDLRGLLWPDYRSLLQQAYKNGAFWDRIRSWFMSRLGFMHLAMTLGPPVILPPTGAASEASWVVPFVLAVRAH